jgi:hypothetical protein
MPYEMSTKIKTALLKRQPFFETTNPIRLINGQVDGFENLTLDLIGDHEILRTTGTQASQLGEDFLKTYSSQNSLAWFCHQNQHEPAFQSTQVSGDTLPKSLEFIEDDFTYQIDPQNHFQPDLRDLRLLLNTAFTKRNLKNILNIETIPENFLSKTILQDTQIKNINWTLPHWAELTENFRQAEQKSYDMIFFSLPKIKNLKDPSKTFFHLFYHMQKSLTNQGMMIFSWHSTDHEKIFSAFKTASDKDKSGSQWQIIDFLTHPHPRGWSLISRT